MCNKTTIAATLLYRCILAVTSVTVVPIIKVYYSLIHGQFEEDSVYHYVWAYQFRYWSGENDFGDEFEWVSPSLQFGSLTVGIGSSDDHAVGGRSDNDSLLGEPVEEQPPGP